MDTPTLTPRAYAASVDFRCDQDSYALETFLVHAADEYEAERLQWGL